MRATTQKKYTATQCLSDCPISINLLHNLFAVFTYCYRNVFHCSGHVSTKIHKDSFKQFYARLSLLQIAVRTWTMMYLTT